MPAVFVLFLMLASCRGKDGDECTLDVFYEDADGDGHGDASKIIKECDVPDGYAATDDDCDDTNAAVYTGADEICDGFDNDCEGSIDDGAIDKRSWFVDGDGDGFGTGDATVACEAPGENYADKGDDCDDERIRVNPGADEICNDRDDDCNDLIDADDPALTDGDNYFVDADGDGWGDPATEVLSCDAVAGYVDRGQDCDDTEPANHPANGETCDGVDNDCDALVDMDDDSLLGAPMHYVDADGDGYGDPEDKGVRSCTAPTGYVDDNTDCDDSDKAYHELLNYYVDADGDGWGTDEATERCQPGDGEAALTGDCDDTDAAINPGMPELCANGDENCNEVEAEPDPAIVFDVWYLDADGDGHGDPAEIMEVCNPPLGYVMSPADDCDDSDPYVHPDAEEVCDGIDNDCNGFAEDSVSVDWFADTDGDGYGDAGVIANNCSEPSGYVRDDTDCNDGVATTNPGAPDICANGIDDNCDDTSDNCIFDILDAGFVFQGDQLGQGLGLTTRTGDFDGDGARDDILMGSEWAERDDGEVYVVNGPLTGTMSAADAISLSPVLDRSYLGAVIGAGDANDDVVDDVLVTPFLGLQSFVFFGPVTASADTLTADISIEVLTPVDLEVVGDFDGDDTSDYAMVSDNVYILSGSVTGSIEATTDASQTWSGGSTGAPDFYPIPVMDVEKLDIDGNGVTELAMGSTQATEGVIWIVPGDLGSGTFVAQDEAMVTIEASGEFASCIVTADYNADGYGDLIADAPEVSESVTHDHFGAVYGFLGNEQLIDGASLTNSDASTDWESAGGAGKQMAIGNFGGDESLDLAMGNPYGEYAQGFVLVAFGPIEEGTFYDDTLLSIPGLENEWHGTSLGAVSDWSGDGADELVIGAQALGAVGIWGAGGNGGAYVVNSEDLWVAP